MGTRLQTLAGQVRGRVVADIGTDHGQLPLLLLEEGSVLQVLATDISANSLKKCETLLADHPHRQRVRLLVTDGLQGIPTERIDTIVISGMGGHRIIGILSRALQEKKPLRRLVLSPQKGEEAVRRFLHSRGFRILTEEFIEEEKKYYTILVAEPGKETYSDEKDYKYGKLLIEKAPADWIRWLDKEIAIREALLTPSLSAASEQAIRFRIEELKEVRNATDHS